MSKALEEVWNWKEAVYEDIKNKNNEEKIKYFFKGLKDSEKILNCSLVKNNDGTYSLQ